MQSETDSFEFGLWTCDDGATARRIDADREAYAAGNILLAFQKEKFTNWE
jgi:hypothetical protein